MFQFKTFSITSPHSPSITKSKMDELHTVFSPRLKWTKNRTTLNWHTWDRFEVRISHLSEIISIKGRLKNINHETTRITYQGRFLWFRTFLNLTLFTLTSLTLLLFSILMIKEIPGLGWLSLFSAIALITGLYSNLIGRPAKQYKRFQIELTKLMSN